MAIEYDRTTGPYDNTNVDNIVEQSGVIDTLAPLAFEIPDKDIITNLNLRINESEKYWNDAKGHDLKNARNENTRFHLGKVDESGLYKHQKQYKENQIFVAEESIIAYVTSQIASPIVIPAGHEDKHKLFAAELEKAIKAFSEKINLERIIEISSRNILNKRVAITHLYFDKQLNDIVVEAENPEHFILDHNAALGQNPEFICHVFKRSPGKLIEEYPEREEEILKELGIQRKTPKQMTKEVAIRRVWLTYYNDKGEAEEGCVTYFGNLVVKKYKNPNYLYSQKEFNLIPYPKKPYIFGNLVNYGDHLIDNTTPLEQATHMQKYLMRRGRQIAENADKANGVLVISTESGLSKDDGQNLTGDPNQKLFIDTSNAKGVDQLVMQLEAQTLPEYVLQDKQDARMQIGNIMGAPTDFTGSQADDGDPTLGEVMVKKNQASGRQDLMVRAITRMLGELYEYIAQMFIVWYTEKRHFTYDAGDGEFDYVTMSRELIHKGIRVKAAKPANPDRSRIEAITLKLLDQKAISLLDAYKLLQLENAQQLYDNWTKQSADPNALARDALDILDTSEAQVAFEDIMNGETIPVKENVTKEYILALRKLMIDGVFTDSKGEEKSFINAPKGAQNRFAKYVDKCIDQLEMKLALEDASEIGPPTGESLRPGAPLPNPNQPQPMGVPGMGASQGMPPGAMPPVGGAMGAPQPPMMSGPVGPPPMGAPMPQPSLSSVFGGTPVPAPGQAPAPQPGSPTSLPQL